MVVLCLDERYSTNLAHWLRSAGMGAEIAESGSHAKAILGAGGKCVLVTDRVPTPMAGLAKACVLEALEQTPPCRGD